MDKKGKKASVIRLIVQISVFTLIFLIAVIAWLAEKGISISLIPDASFHAICPFCEVVTIYEFVMAGTFIQKIHIEV